MLSRALVSRTPSSAKAPTEYLVVAGDSHRWTYDPESATAFDSMREAARAALRLPSALRAYGLPLPAVLLTHQLH